MDDEAVRCPAAHEAGGERADGHCCECRRGAVFSVSSQSSEWKEVTAQLATQRLDTALVHSRSTRLVGDFGEYEKVH